jgi:hypothetical protein
MSSGLTSTLSEFSRKSEFANSPLAAETTSRRPSRPSFMSSLTTRVRAWLGRLVSWPGRLFSSAFARYLLAFFLGAAAMLAWESYGNAARRTIAGWSPRLAFIAPKTTSGISSEQIRATSLALSAVHQSVDKLATEISRLEAQGSSDSTGSRRSRR